MLLSTTRKFCWFTISSIFNISSESGAEGVGEEEEQLRLQNQVELHTPEKTTSQILLQDPQQSCIRQRNLIKHVIANCCACDSVSQISSTLPIVPRPPEMGVVKCCGGGNSTTTTFSFGKADDESLAHNFEDDYLENSITNPEKTHSSSSSWSPNNTKPKRCRKRGILESASSTCSLNKKVLNYQDAPSYLQFNPFITGGYRSNLSPRDCVKSLFWWTNETINIWSHLVGWIFFMCLSVYDVLGLLDLPTSHPWDQTVITFLLASFQACMLLSSLYHIFCCHSENYYRRWLSADLIGVSLSLLAIYISGIYYAFSCVPFWLNFYLVTVGAIFATAMGMQILPLVSKKDMVTEENFHFRLILFGGWAAYGIVPTVHWAFLHGGMSSPAVALLLPRIFWMYVLSATAFLFYVFRIPERFWPGVVNYLGSSHQMWHILIVAAFYHWHNTGLMYLHFRASNPCSEEYAFLFPAEVEQQGSSSSGIGIEKLNLI